MIEEFMKHVSSYDKNKEEVVNKIEHSLRVYEMMSNFASELGFNDEEIELAGVIGLLHDIGRFEQIKLADSFNDLNGFDHADYGVKILFEDGLIENFYTNKKNYPVIDYAIKNHNKLTLEPVRNELTMKMSKLIRDVDKIDIFYLLGVLGQYDKKGDDSNIKREVFEEFGRRESINKKFIETNNEMIASTFSYAFDINYDISLPYIKKYVKVLYERVEIGNTFKNIYDEIVKYLDERIDKTC